MADLEKRVFGTRFSVSTFSHFWILLIAMLLRLPLDISHVILEDFIGILCARSLSALDIAACNHRTRRELLVLLTKIRPTSANGEAAAALLGNYIVWVALRKLQVHSLCVDVSCLRDSITALKVLGKVQFTHVKALSFHNPSTSPVKVNTVHYAALLYHMCPHIERIDCSAFPALTNEVLLLFGHLKFKSLNLRNCTKVTPAAVERVLHAMSDTIQELSCDVLEQPAWELFACICTKLKYMRITCNLSYIALDRICSSTCCRLEVLHFHTASQKLTAAQVHTIAQRCPMLRIFTAECKIADDNVLGAESWNAVITHCLLLERMHLMSGCSVVDMTFFRDEEVHFGRTGRINIRSSNSEMLSQCFVGLAAPHVRAFSSHCTAIGSNSLRLIANLFGADLHAFDSYIDDIDVGHLLYFLSRCPYLRELALDCTVFSLTDSCLTDIANFCPKLIKLTVKCAFSISDDGVSDMLIKFQHCTRLKFQHCSRLKSLTLDTCPELTDITLAAIAAFPDTFDFLTLLATGIRKESVVKFIVSGKLSVRVMLVCSDAAWVRRELAERDFKCSFRVHGND